MKREKAERLFNLLGEIDDQIIAEAEVVENKSSQILPFKQKRNMTQAVTIAASIAFLVVSVWGFGQLGMRNDADSDWNAGNMAIESPESDSGVEGIIVGEAEEADETEEAEWSDSFSFFDRLVGDFSHPLTDEQIASVFPGLDSPVVGKANYWRDGALSGVSAHIYMVDDIWIRISIAQGELHPCCSFHSGGPVYLEIYGVEVIVEHGAARFMLYDVGYVMYINNFSDALSQMDEAIISQLILGGPADLSVLENPEIPEIWTESRTLEEARLDPDFGDFVPVDAPYPFQFQRGNRSVNQNWNGMSLSWEAPWDENYLTTVFQSWIANRTSNVPPFALDEIFLDKHYVHWTIAWVNEYDLSRIVSIYEPESWDFSLYPLVQWADSWRRFHEIPYGEAFHYNPVFFAEELTFEAVSSREWLRVFASQGAYADDPSDNFRDIEIPFEAYELEFSILFGDIIVAIRTRGFTAQQVWEMVQSIGWN